MNVGTQHNVSDKKLNASSKSGVVWPALTEREIVRIAVEDTTRYEPAMSEIWERYKKRLYLYIKYKLNINKGFETDKERYIIEDILQNTFCDVLENLNEYNPQYEVSTWIYNICNKHIVRYIREVQKYQGRTIAIEDESVEVIRLSSDSVKPDQEFEVKEFERIITFFVKSLQHKADQEVFLLYLQNLHNHNISDLLGKTQDAVRARLNRVIKRFKKFMTKQYPEYLNSTMLSQIKNLSFGSVNTENDFSPERG